MATLSDWLATCQPSVPAVCCLLACRPPSLWRAAYREVGRKHAARDDQVRKDERRHAERQENRLASILSAISLPFCASNAPLRVPGCIVESMTFFAFHSSGVISWILPVLYAVTICLAFSSPADEVNRVLHSVRGQWYGLKRMVNSHSKNVQCN